MMRGGGKREKPPPTGKRNIFKGAHLKCNVGTMRGKEKIYTSFHRKKKFLLTPIGKELRILGGGKDIE